MKFERKRNYPLMNKKIYDKYHKGFLNNIINKILLYINSWRY
jgi:hypothetical protein